MKKGFKIGKLEIKGNSRVFIIAEAGVNNNQDLNLALKLVDIAAEAGADAVKFQTFKAEQVVTGIGEMAAYQKKNMGEITSQREMLKTLELKDEFYPEIVKRCKEKNILFMSTPHGGVDSADFLERLEISVYKVGSGDLTNYLLLERLAKTGKPIILSSGMATMDEVKASVNFLKLRGCKNIAMLHCTTNYPCPPEEVNLAAMVTMMDKLDIIVGYSDHTQEVQVATMAATLGAAIYECHFTLDKSLPGPDHLASANPQELKERIEAIRKVRTILGNPLKSPNESEKSMIKTVRKSLVAARDVAEGKILTKDDLEAKRPGNGVSPTKYEFFVGKRLKKELKKDEQLKRTDIE